MHVIVSTYHETSFNKNIQYSSKRVINYINIIKNQENDLQNTTKNLQNDPNGFAYDLFAYDLQKKKFNFDPNSQINVYLRKDKTSKSKRKKIF